MGRDREGIIFAICHTWGLSVKAILQTPTIELIEKAYDLGVKDGQREVNSSKEVE